MSKYLGDFGAGDTIDFKFTTFRPSTGAAFTLGGTPVISVYKDNSTTESTAGVALTADFDARTGLNHVRITTSTDGAFYADGSSFECVITTGTVDSVSVVGSCVGRFTLRDQACLYPTVHARKLDVTTAGEAGIDWANIGSPTSTVSLSGTTVGTATTLGSSAITSTTIATTGYQAIADGILKRKLDSSGDETSSSTANERTVRHALRYLRNKVGISGSTMTVTQEDDTTTAWTATLTTSPGVDPVTTIDPA
jgi:hypothetical protein